MAGPLILGATGRVGCALRASGVMTGAIWQSRTPRDGFLTWDILQEPAPAVDCTGVIMMAGGVADTDVYVPLATAACDLGAQLDVPVLIASSQAAELQGSVYGTAKRNMERAVADRARTTCLRIGNVAGSDALFRAMAAGPVQLDEVSKGQGPRRAMIGPVTLARVLLRLLETDLSPILNVAQPDLIDMADLLRAAGVDWSWKEAPDGVLAALDLDVSALTRLVDVPRADATTLVAEARATGWVPA